MYNHWLILKDFLSPYTFSYRYSPYSATVKTSTKFSYFGVVRTGFNPEILNHVQTNLQIINLYQFKIQHNFPRKKTIKFEISKSKKKIFKTNCRFAVFLKFSCHLLLLHFLGKRIHRSRLKICSPAGLRKQVGLR